MKLNESYIGLRTDLLKYITIKNCSVLDVGCAAGANGKWLLTSGVAKTVVGIECDRDMADEAKKHCSKVYVANLNTENCLGELMADEKFDYIILGDVLEHLIDPWSSLKSFTQMLHSNGKVILSIPNAQHIDTFIQLYIKGRWPYNNRGLFDRTHLRLFTWTNIEDLARHADLTLVCMERKFRYRDALGSQFPFYGPLLKTLFRNLYTFQYIAVFERNK